MNRHWKHLALPVVGGMVAIGVFAAAAMTSQPQQGGGDDDLPPGFSVDDATGALVQAAPPGIRFESKDRKAKLKELVDSLSVGAFEIDSAGYIQSFELNQPLGDYEPNTLLRCRSVTLDQDSHLVSLTLADTHAAGDSGCDLVVVITETGTSFSCDKTTCQTACDVDFEIDEGTGEITIFCVCRPAP